MRTFKISVDKDLRLGLRNYRLPRGTVRLKMSVNLVPRDWGMETAEVVNNPVPKIGINWPFPQLIEGKKELLLCDKTSIAKLDNSTDPWTIDYYDNFRDYANLSTSKDITAGGVWHFMDFYDTWMLFNGKSMIMQTNLHNVSTDPDVLRVQEDVSIQTGCEFKGRGIYGGFNPDDFFTTGWNTLWTAWEALYPSNITPKREVRSNFVWWSSVGGGDLLFPFYSDLAQSGNIPDSHDTDTELWIDYLKRNEWGMMPMPWRGTVRVVKPLGNSVIVYGDEGVSALIPISDPNLPPTFGLRTLNNIGQVGIQGRGAVAGDDLSHIFLDKLGFLWRINADFSVERLGYREFMADLIDNEVVMSFDQGTRDVYIADDKHTYLLSANGLCEVGQRVTSVNRIAGKLEGISNISGNDAIEVEIGDFDMKSKGIKQIIDVQLGIDAESTPMVAIKYRFGRSQRWRQSKWFRVNDNGVATPQQSGTEFAVLVLIAPKEATLLDSIEVNYQYSDLRFDRSIDVSQINTRASRSVLG